MEKDMSFRIRQTDFTGNHTLSERVPQRIYDTVMDLLIQGKVNDDLFGFMLFDEESGNAYRVDMAKYIITFGKLTAKGKAEARQPRH